MSAQQEIQGDPFWRYCQCGNAYSLLAHTVCSECAGWPDKKYSDEIDQRVRVLRAKGTAK